MLKRYVNVWLVCIKFILAAGGVGAIGSNTSYQGYGSDAMKNRDDNKTSDSSKNYNESTQYCNFNINSQNKDMGYGKVVVVVWISTRSLKKNQLLLLLLKQLIILHGLPHSQQLKYLHLLQNQLKDQQNLVKNGMFLHQNPNNNK